MTGQIVNPLDDQRPFATVLGDWRTRHGLTYEQTAEVLGDGRFGGAAIARATIALWLSGRQRPRTEAAMRALMTMIDEGRA